MQPKKSFLLTVFMLMLSYITMSAQSRRPIDNQHPLWLVHVDVWNKADPQKIIDLIPEDIKPYVCLNLSLSCQYDTAKNVYKMPQNAVYTYKSWASVCQANKMWFTCQPASGGHTHIQDDDLVTFEYFYKHYPNFLGWNYAEQFWGFDEPNDESSSTQNSRIALFAKLIPMAHQYGGFLTISFCGNIWSHGLSPNGMVKRNADLLAACQAYPEAILWLYKYTTSSCFYNNESVTISPFISGLAKNYGVRYDNCGWNGAKDILLGNNNGAKYPEAAGIGTIMEQTAMNGGAVWDGPELIWTEDFKNLNNTVVDTYTRRNWGTFPGFRNVWIDMFRKIIDGTIYIPSRTEVVGKTKAVIVNDIASGSDEEKYASWGDLYNGLYKVDDPFNKDNGQMMNNLTYFKRSGRYGTIPVVTGLYDAEAEAISTIINKSSYSSRWATEADKVAEFNKLYPEVSTGDLYVQRFKNQLVTYTPYTYLNKKTSASAIIPLQYNSCGNLQLTYGKLSSGVIREYADHIDFYLNNYRSDTLTLVKDQVAITGCSSKPTYSLTPRQETTSTASEIWDAQSGTFSLDVFHNGPIDLTLNCVGNATKNNSDVVTTAKTNIQTPQQPGDFDGKIIIETEDMDYKYVKRCVLNPYDEYPNERGHSGNGFMDMGTNMSGSLRHTVDIAKAGTFRVALRYLSTMSGNIELDLNGQKQLVAIEKTETNQWKKAIVKAQLVQGENKLNVNNIQGLDCYLDQVVYTPEEMPDEKFLVTIQSVEHGSVIPNLGEAQEGEKIFLTVTPDKDYALAGWEIVHGNLTIAEDNSFVMPEDNVTLRPIYINTAQIYNLDFSTTGNGTLPPGWQTLQEDNQVHAYPNTYSSGPRTFSGFTGYQGKALYWRNGNAEYGKNANYSLTLEPGKYILTYAMAAWKNAPTYKAAITTLDGSAIATSNQLTATPNASGSTSANLSTAAENTLGFNITTKDNYVINFSADAGYNEYLLLECSIKKDDTDRIIGILTQQPQQSTVIGIYNASGVRLSHLQQGLNIVRYANGSTRKIIMNL